MKSWSDRSSKRLIVLAAMVAAGATISAAALAATHGRASARIAGFSNGGARQWLAFDPGTGSLGKPFVAEYITIANTSNTAGTFTVLHEPGNVKVCQGSLGAAQSAICQVTSSKTSSGQLLTNGYLQAVASVNVVMGGQAEIPGFSYTLDASNNLVPDRTKGDVTHTQFIWQQACPPVSGAGCPTGNTAAAGGVNATK